MGLAAIKESVASLDLARINRELAEQTRAYQTFSPAQPSNLLFDKPVQGPLSSPFGLRRFFNGEERNPHSGLDFAVGAGTPIKAPAAGKVILIGNYFFNGNTVFVDHGQGLISMFCHMSKVDVKLGQSLPRGGIVGRVGATGRATGPHLHYEVLVAGRQIDPLAVAAQVAQAPEPADDEGGLAIGGPDIAADGLADPPAPDEAPPAPRDTIGASSVIWIKDLLRRYGP